MANQWFNAPAVADSDGDYWPKYRDRVDGFSAFVVANSPRYFVRFYADQSVLDGIAAEADADAVSESSVVNALENDRGETWDTTQLTESFYVDMGTQ